jgi:hypothetical protein
MGLGFRYRQRGALEAQAHAIVFPADDSKLYLHYGPSPEEYSGRSMAKSEYNANTHIAAENTTTLREPGNQERVAKAQPKRKSQIAQHRNCVLIKVDLAINTAASAPLSRNKIAALPKRRSAGSPCGNAATNIAPSFTILISVQHITNTRIMDNATATSLSCFELTSLIPLPI